MTPRRHGDGVLSAALARHLAGLGLCHYEGVGPAEPRAYVETMPDKPDFALLLKDRPGPPPDKVNDWSYPVVEGGLRVPAGPARPALNLLKQIVDAIHGTHNVWWAESTEDAVFITECAATTSGPLPLGTDQAGRYRWSVTFQTEVLTQPA